MSDDAKHQGQPPANPFDSGDDEAAGTTAHGQSAGGDQRESVVDPASVLEARVKELEAQQADLTDRLLRAHAEMDNLRKRMEREKIDGMRFAISKFANDIVGVGDNFQRAVEAVPKHAVEVDATLKAVVEGVQMTERAFTQVLERHGVTRLDPAGQPFDPNKHQAVMEQENPDVPAGTVLQVFQVGYLLEERVLRPAMVSVARGGAKAGRSAGQGEDPGRPANENTGPGEPGQPPWDGNEGQ